MSVGVHFSNPNSKERNAPGCSAVILAGGESKRMGRDKAWVKFQGKTLIHWALEKVQRLGIEEIFISGRAGEDYSALRLPVLHDLEPGFGPMGGLERGLQACTTPLLLVLAIDLPHMSTGFLQKLISMCDSITGVVPKLRGELEPLAAIYPKRCHELAFQALFKGKRAVREFAHDCRRERAVRLLRVSRAEEACFTNCNHPADLVSSATAEVSL